jgi:molybdopterin-guanine dinucleotide biosynthesis protein B
MIPTICIVGKQASGKTTLLERLVPAFHDLGHKVAVVKHAPHGSEIDRPGSDSWRLRQTGADLVVLSGPGQEVALIPQDGDLSLADLASLPLFDNCDLLLAEGYKQSGFPKVEVHRAALGAELLLPESQLIAVVSDAPLSLSIPVFAWEQVRELALFLDETFVRSLQASDSLHVSINGQPIPLNTFATAVISRGILGMLSALKGVGEVNTFRVSFWRGARSRGGKPPESSGN